MLHNCDEDSGRSSCSVGSSSFSPITDHHEFNEKDYIHYASKTVIKHDSCTKLKVTKCPRSSVMLSPDDKEPFPSCRLLRNQRNPVLNLFNTPRKGGLSNAHSTLDIVSSTQIEQPKLENNAFSMTNLETKDNRFGKFNMNLGPTNFRRGKPVQRAASRLYKADCGFKGKDDCIGPEFIVRTCQPVKSIDLTLSSSCEKRTVTIILLNGQRIELICDPNSITCGQLFDALVYNEKYEHSFMLGIATLMAGDFVFLPDDYKIKKIAPENWSKVGNKKNLLGEVTTFTLFLRIKFFLPTNIARNIQGGEWRHRVYLQLRRATVEGQLTSTIQNLILLAGYALHIEFGEFSYKEHGSSDYFLLEHYLPESSITSDMTDIKLRMKKAHESRRGLEKSKAILNYITHAQTFRDYGSHFYSAIWATRDGFCREVWLSIGPRGITLYSRSCQISHEIENKTRLVLQSLPWHHIQNFYYNKKSLYIIPNTNSGLSKAGIKYKLKMSENKSCFTFWLASLHHRLYLKLYEKEDFISYLSNEIRCPIYNKSPKKNDCSNYEDSYNMAVRNHIKIRKPVRRKFKVDFFNDKKINKENEEPSTEQLLKKLLLSHNDDDTMHSPGNSSNDALSSSDCSLPRRHGVKMGTKVFNGMKSTLQSRHQRSPIYQYHSEIKSEADLVINQSDSDDFNSDSKQHFYVNRMKLLPERNYNQDLCHAATAYVLESPKACSDVYNFNIATNDSCLNTSLFEKLDNMGCLQGERIFVTAILQRNDTNALGLQVAEGSDGNVYIKSLTPGGPADLSKKVLPGDQIISVNGQTLLNVKYDNALTMLQSAPKRVELIVLQSTNNTNITNNVDDLSKLQTGEREKVINHKCQSIADNVGDDFTDDDLLNEEALKTVYALIKLTKEKLLNRMKGNIQNSPNNTKMQKCSSEINVSDCCDNESSGQGLSRRSYTQPEDVEKFNTWRYPLPSSKLKRRPLSLSILKDTNLTADYLAEDADFLMNNPSIKSVQSSGESEKVDNYKHIPLPKNFGLSRKWLGPVRYPVTPCKNNMLKTDPGAITHENVVRKHFIYGAENSDDDQIFL